MAAMVLCILEGVTGEVCSGPECGGPQHGSRPARSHEPVAVQETDMLLPHVTRSGLQAVSDAAGIGRDLPAPGNTLTCDGPTIPQEPSPRERIPPTSCNNVAPVPNHCSMGLVMPIHEQAACLIVGEEPKIVYLLETEQLCSRSAESPVQENATFRPAEQDVHQPTCGLARDRMEGEEEDQDLPATHANAPQISTLIQEAMVDLVPIDSLAMLPPSR
ncbi:MAG: hypothetical protein ACTJLK_01355 [Anaplasma sp.]